MEKMPGRYCLKHHLQIKYFQQLLHVLLIEVHHQEFLQHPSYGMDLESNYEIPGQIE